MYHSCITQGERMVDAQFILRLIFLFVLVFVRFAVELLRRGMRIMRTERLGMVVECLTIAESGKYHAPFLCRHFLLSSSIPSSPLLYPLPPSRHSPKRHKTRTKPPLNPLYPAPHAHRHRVFNESTNSGIISNSAREIPRPLFPQARKPSYV